MIPPSTARPAPIIKPASSEARKTMPLAMSVTVPMRPIGSRASAWRRASSMVVGAEIARPHDPDLIAHLGLGRPGVDRVDQCQVDYPMR